MALNNFSNEPDSKSRILESARVEILKNGIIGMRVSDVARGADTSITLIYRYFVDRNGVLARFLTMIMFNLMFVYYDLVDEDKISADEYRAMLVNQIRNSAKLASH